MKEDRDVQTAAGTVGGCGFFLPAPVFAEPRSGTVSWDKGNFEWAVYDDQSLILTNVSYDGEPVLVKASLPAIRVKYGRERLGIIPTAGSAWDGRRSAADRSKTELFGNTWRPYRLAIQKSVSVHTTSEA